MQGVLLEYTQWGAECKMCYWDMHTGELSSRCVTGECTMGSRVQDVLLGYAQCGAECKVCYWGMHTGELSSRCVTGVCTLGS